MLHTRNALHNNLLLLHASNIIQTAKLCDKGDAINNVAMNTRAEVP